MQLMNRNQISLVTDQGFDNGEGGVSLKMIKSVKKLEIIKKNAKNVNFGQKPNLG